MYKNVAQKLYVFAFDQLAGVPKTGDAGNITCYSDKDGAASAAILGDTNPTEVDATNMPGWYVFDITATESNADEIIFHSKSATANITVDPISVFTRPDKSAIADTVWDEQTSGHVASGSFGEQVEVVDPANLQTLLNGVNVLRWLGTSVTLSSGAPDVNIQSTDNIDLSTTQKASVNTEADAAIVTYGLDHLVFGSVTGSDVADNSIFARLVSLAAPADWDDFNNVTDSLEAIAANISPAAGSGAISWTYTLTSTTDGAGIPDADIWVTSGAAGSTVLASGRTDQNGAITFMLDAGTVYVWRQKSGWNFTNPDTETVS